MEIHVVRRARATGHWSVVALVAAQASNSDRCVAIQAEVLASHDRACRLERFCRLSPPLSNGAAFARGASMWVHHMSLGCILLSACYVPSHDRDHEVEPDDTVRQSSASPLSRSEFCQQWAQAACSPAVVSACQASGADACQQTQAEFCRSLVPDTISGAGRSDCIAAVANAYRDADLSADELDLVLRFGGVCARTTSAASRTGSACTQSSDCDLGHGYACVMKADSSMGTCQIPQPVDPGRDCAAVAESCSEGFFCDGQHCIETLDVGDACVIQAQCGDSAFCDDSGQCTATRGVDSSCQQDVECTRGVCSEFDGDQVCTDHVVLSRADPLCANLR
jgi:hypothetical protein